MLRSKQSKQIDVEKGLLLVSYETADDEDKPPKVAVIVKPAQQNNIELVLNPDDQDATLWRPGSCLVVRARRAGQLMVEVSPIEVGGSTAATVKFETLTQGKSPPVRGRDVGASARAGRLSILGHVAGFGDVVVREDEWIAGPEAPARIEGLAIDWPAKPDDVELRYSVVLGRPHAASGDVAQLGEYAGTRGRALPIVGVSLGLVGRGASNFQLVGEATFLGAPLMCVRGDQVTLSGPSGREPLVGFRIRLNELSVPLQPVLPRETAAKSSRVRVFRPPLAKGALRSTTEPFLG